MNLTPKCLNHNTLRPTTIIPFRKLPMMPQKHHFDYKVRPKTSLAKG